MSDAPEIWKDVVGYEGLYKVSDLGNVIGPKGKQLKLIKGKFYYKITLCRDGKCKTATVHDVVAAAFIGEKPKGSCCCHNNGNGLDNRPRNLRYASYKENSADMRLHGTHQWGENHPSCKISDEQALEIRRLYKPKCKVNGARALGRKYGLCGQTVERIAKGLARKYLNEGYDIRLRTEKEQP